jgi:hypothetical protein
MGNGIPYELLALYPKTDWYWLRSGKRSDRSTRIIIRTQGVDLALPRLARVRKLKIFKQLERSSAEPCSTAAITFIFGLGRFTGGEYSFTWN